MKSLVYKEAVVLRRWLEREAENFGFMNRVLVLNSGGETKEGQNVRARARLEGHATRGEHRILERACKFFPPFCLPPR